MNMVQIITDSSTLYKMDEAQKLGFESVPLCVTIGDMEGRDLHADYDEFYDRISKGQIPMSSQPPLGDVIDAFEKYKDDEIINISMADGLSGTYQTACSAREMSDHKDNITVVNSKTLCGPHRYMVKKAQEMKMAGCSKQEILDWLDYAIEHGESFLIPQDFDFLRRGGRLTPVAATIGSVLKLKPIMTLTQDCKRLDKFAVKRTMKAAVGEVIEHLKTRKLDARHLISVSHARALDDATKAAERLKEAFPEAEVEILDLSHAFITQGGPQCVAIQYIEK